MSYFLWEMVCLFCCFICRQNSDKFQLKRRCLISNMIATFVPILLNKVGLFRILNTNFFL